MKIGENVYVHGYVDEIRNDTVIIRNEGGYFGTVPSEIICGEMLQPEPKSGMVFGYQLEYLVAFAEACRRAGVDESDLKTFANNCGFAYATMEEEYRHNINQAIDAFMGNVGGMNESD